MVAGSMALVSRAAKRGCFKRGGFSIWTCPSFFVLFCPLGTFPGIFPICPGTLRGSSRLVLFLFLGLLSAPTRNSPERVRDTIWTIPGKSGKHPGLETPRFSFSQLFCRYRCRLETLAEFVICSVSVLLCSISSNSLHFEKPEKRDARLRNEIGMNFGNMALSVLSAMSGHGLEDGVMGG